MSSIPDGWVKCPPHEAERFFDEVNGVLREFTETDFQYIVRVGIDVEVDLLTRAFHYVNGFAIPLQIPSAYWETFGIKPLRKVEVKPIEFEGEVMSYDARAYETLYLEIPDNIKKQWKAGMKFKCVQVMDGEE